MEVAPNSEHRLQHPEEPIGMQQSVQESLAMAATRLGEAPNHSSVGLYCLAEPHSGTTYAALPDQTRMERTLTYSGATTASSSSAKKTDVCAPSELSGRSLGACGGLVLHRLLEVVPLRSETTGKLERLAIFPLPTSRNLLEEFDPGLSCDEVTWLLCVCLSLNSVWGGLSFCDEPINGAQRSCLQHLCEYVRSFCSMTTLVQELDWGEFLQVRSVDYRGDEVRVAQHFAWRNIEPALPVEIGRVPLADVCVGGCKTFVEEIDRYLKPTEEWGKIKAPRVMVDEADWADVCKGLLKSGICGLILEEDIFKVNGVPLLNGLFGVTKDETTAEGTEVFRLIMNLVPFNQISMSLAGDVNTLPNWSMMTPYYLAPGEDLLVSSEDIRCFFYTMAIPQCWQKYLAFNRPVPSVALPQHLQGEKVYLTSLVLPMGYLNSVSLAQHVHRNLVKFTESTPQEPEDSNLSGQELRKDRPFPSSSVNWRVYLDNYDLLEKVRAVDVDQLKDTVSPRVLSLRQQYEHWEIPRNVKKSVQRSQLCEMQGATVDGRMGVAYPREAKLCKYFALAYSLLSSKVATQKQLQIVCGGLVYFTMFRRPLLGCLNAVWTHITSFSGRPGQKKVTPSDCKLEMDDPGVLCIGLFDGIGAIRVALELLGVPVLGYVSVEKEPTGQRVVSSHFPGVVHFQDITQLTDSDFKDLSLQFSQCALVIIGAGPPCQGVSGLNADRKGALKDSRSSLFTFVEKVRGYVRRHFTWCPSYSLMESVGSMDPSDRDLMSASLVRSLGSVMPRALLGAVALVVHFKAMQSLEAVTQAGWTKVDTRHLEQVPPDWGGISARPTVSATFATESKQCGGQVRGARVQAWEPHLCEG
eukprot:Skav224823  [mRNA]  locus=scaffold613:211653:214870:- [translate_table: standard]